MVVIYMEIVGYIFTGYIFTEDGWNTNTVSIHLETHTIFDLLKQNNYICDLINLKLIK